MIGSAWAERNARYTGRPVRELLQPTPDRAGRQVGLWVITFALNAVVLAVFIEALGTTAVGDAVLLGVLAWLGWAATLSAWPVIHAGQPAVTSRRRGPSCIGSRGVRLSVAAV